MPMKPAPNPALVPMPFPEFAVDEPANVVTEAVDRSILRITLESATKAYKPLGEMAIELTKAKSALVPIPSVDTPLPEPAIVVTKAVEITIWRMMI
jgi:hypothetical protein